jgi:hypothetical protein
MNGFVSRSAMDTAAQLERLGMPLGEAAKLVVEVTATARRNSSGLASEVAHPQGRYTVVVAFISSAGNLNYTIDQPESEARS